GGGMNAAMNQPSILTLRLGQSDQAGHDYSPIRKSNGHGKQVAYLSSVDEAVLELILSKSAPKDVSHFAYLRTSSFSKDPNEAAGDAIQQIIADDPDLTSTEKENLTKARRGQGQFKRNLLQIERACRFTGVEDQRLLIASHILAWSACSTSNQRLDGNNGLLLTPNADRLFDRHYISLADNGQVLVANFVSDNHLNALGLGGLRGKKVGAFNTDQKRYLEFHRKLFEEKQT
ncbi:MAG: HNH endonuclease, partial [Pseudomonadota bacterium]